MTKLFHACLLLVVASIMSGCATYKLIEAAPTQSEPLTIVYSDEGASGWSDLPIGAYRVPDSQVIIFGHQKNSVGFLFGVVGILAQNAVQSSQGASAVADVRTVLQVNLNHEAEEISTALIGSGQFGSAYRTGAGANGPVLTVNPYVVITFVNDVQVRPYVILKATLRGPKNNSLWTARYIASVDKPLPLEGIESYTADGGARLKAALAKELELDIKFMLADVASPRVRDDTKLLYVESSVPFMRQRLGMLGYEISQDDGSVVFAPKIGDALVMAGVHVLDKSVTTYRPATKDDKLKLLED